ncbi:uncharacterized protein [Anoplolepis gracilipes]|uniref:uncharacterized protein n=1 Tax=Anoplolepis gracilipes TaxID=354296 RepID=UPI003B9F9F58
MVESGCSLEVVADPIRVPPDDDHWVGDTLGSVAIIAGPAAGASFPVLRARGQGFIAADWGPNTVVWLYLPPSLSVREYGGRLDELAACLRGLAPRPAVIAGDFNAHSLMWSSPRTNPNERLVETWAAVEDLRIFNQGSGNTFVGHRGGSIVDLTWASPAALRRVSEWRVLDYVETGSDHLYVWFLVVLTRDGTIPPPTTASPRRLRWSLKKLDEDKLLACIHTACWPDKGKTNDIIDPNAKADRFMSGVIDACAASTLLVPEVSVRKRTYWWAPGIASLRSECAHQGRRLCRATKTIRTGPPRHAERTPKTMA